MAHSYTSWAKFKRGLSDADPRLIQFLDELMKSADLRDNAVLVCDYSFGDWVIEDGVPKLPNREDFPQDRNDFPQEFVTESGLPFGFIKKNTVEIVEWAHSVNGTELQRPLVHLARGKTIGLFELCDWLDGHAVLAPDWNASAGSRLITPIWKLGHTRTRQIARGNGKSLGHVDPKSSSSVFTFLKKAYAGPMESESKQPERWVCSIGYINPSAFNSLKKYKTKEENKRLRHLLAGATLTAQRSDRPMSSGLLYRSILKRSKSQPGLSDAAVQILELLSQILQLNRPAFRIYHDGLASDEFEELLSIAPLDELSKILRNGHEKYGGIAVPSQIGGNRVAFYPLELCCINQLKQSAENTIEQRLEDVLHDTFSSQEPHLDTVRKRISHLNGRVHLRRPRISGDVTPLISWSNSGEVLNRESYYTSLDGPNYLVNEQFNQTFWDQVLLRIRLGN